MKDRKTIFTAVCLSTIVAIIVNLIFPDIYLMAYFHQIGQNQLFTYGLIGLLVSVVIMLIVNQNKRGH